MAECLFSLRLSWLIYHTTSSLHIDIRLSSSRHVAAADIDAFRQALSPALSFCRRHAILRAALMAADDAYADYFALDAAADAVAATLLLPMICHAMLTRAMPALRRRRVVCCRHAIHELLPPCLYTPSRHAAAMLITLLPC